MEDCLTPGVWLVFAYAGSCASHLATSLDLLELGSSLGLVFKWVQALGTVEGRCLDCVLGWCAVIESHSFLSWVPRCRNLQHAVAEGSFPTVCLLCGDRRQLGQRAGSGVRDSIYARA